MATSRCLFFPVGTLEKEPPIAAKAEALNGDAAALPDASAPYYLSCEWLHLYKGHSMPPDTDLSGGYGTTHNSGQHSAQIPEPKPGTPDGHLGAHRTHFSSLCQKASRFGRLPTRWTDFSLAFTLL